MLMNNKYDNLVGATPQWINFMKSVDEIVANKESIYTALDKAQEIYGYLKNDCIKYIARAFCTTSTEICSIASFVSRYKFTKQGKHQVAVCIGAGCFAKGEDKIFAEFKKQLGIDENQTTQDGLFTLTSVRCIGACGMAPVVVIDHHLYGNMTTEKVKTTLDIYRNLEKK